MFESMIHKQECFVSLTFPEHSNAGRLLGKIIYSNFLSSLLTQEKDYSASPNDGCQNKLYLRMPVEDVMAFADLIEESCNKQPGMPELVKTIRDKVNVQVVKENQRLNIRGI